jgi:hypothetical protein
MESKFSQPIDVAQPTGAPSLSLPKITQRSLRVRLSRSSCTVPILGSLFSNDCEATVFSVQSINKIITVPSPLSLCPHPAPYHTTRSAAREGRRYRTRMVTRRHRTGEEERIQRDGGRAELRLDEFQIFGRALHSFPSREAPWSLQRAD